MSLLADGHHPLINDVWSIMQTVDWPEEVDYKGAIHGLMRVHFTYQLPPVDLARGLIRNRQTLARLSSQDCLFLAQERMQGDNPLLVEGGIDYAVAIEWAEAALEYDMI
jgi:hypothetical protein